MGSWAGSHGAHHFLAFVKWIAQLTEIGSKKKDLFYGAHPDWETLNSTDAQKAFLAKLVAKTKFGQAIPKSDADIQQLTKTQASDLTQAIFR